jgi:FMN-dependent NADH-azoreductase
MELFGAFRMIQVSSYGRCAMTKSNLGSSPTPDLDAKAMKAIVKAQDLPPGSARTEALKKADQLCNAADIYRYVFSTELKPPQ